MRDGSDERFGLREEEIERIRKVFAAHPGVHRVVVYGSRAKGTYRPGSDIDLTLHGEDLDVGELLKIDGERDELLLPYRIDLSIHGQISSRERREHIERVGRALYERSGAVA